MKLKDVVGMVTFDIRNHKKILDVATMDLEKIYCECGNIGQGKKEFVKAITNESFSVLCYVRLFTSFFGSTVFGFLTSLLGSFSPISFKNEIV